MLRFRSAVPLPHETLQGSHASQSPTTQSVGQMFSPQVLVLSASPVHGFPWELPGVLSLDLLSFPPLHVFEQPPQSDQSLHLQSTGQSSK